MKKRIILISLFLVFVLAVLFSHVYFVPSTFIKRPFKNLKLDDIENVKISAFYIEEKTYELSEDEKETLLALLNRIKIKRRMNFKWNEKDGGAYINEEGGISSSLLITFKSGETVTLSAHNKTVMSGQKEIYKYRHYVIKVVNFVIRDVVEVTLGAVIAGGGG